MIKNVFFGIPLVLLFGCEFKHQSKMNVKNDSKQPLTTDTLTSRSVQTKIVSEGKIDSFYFVLDSLKNLFLISHDLKILKQIEKSALHSEGCDEEEAGGIIADIFESDSRVIINFLSNQKNNKLRNLLIEEWSAVLAHDESERLTAISNFKKDKLKMAAEQKFTSKEIAFLSGMLAQINPSKYD